MVKWGENKVGRAGPYKARQFKNPDMISLIEY